MKGRTRKPCAHDPVVLNKGGRCVECGARHKELNEMKRAA